LFKSSAIATALILLMFCVLVVSGFAQSSVFAPIWMKLSAYAEYSFGEGFRFLSDKTSVKYEGGTYRWECIELTGTVAKLNLTLSFNEGDSVTQFSAEALVDTLNRSAYSLDGTLLGTTHLWLESNPDNGEEVVLWDLPPDKIVGKINTFAGFTETPQGKQESYLVTGNGTINNNTALFSIYCNMNTGILTMGLPWNEATLSALNTGLINMMTLTDTNIDLGPSSNEFDFGALLPPALIVVAFVFIFVTVYRRRRKKHKPASKP
jgi:hypothetical protein